MQTHAHGHKGNAKPKAERHHEPSVLERLEALLDAIKAQARHNAPITPDMIRTVEEIVTYGRDHDKRDE